jgi:hypothetical protein
MPITSDALLSFRTIIRRLWLASLTNPTISLLVNDRDKILLILVLKDEDQTVTSRLRLRAAIFTTPPPPVPSVPAALSGSSRPESFPRSSEGSVFSIPFIRPRIYLLFFDISPCTQAYNV